MSGKRLYAGSVTHDEHTIERMFCVQYDQFCMRQELAIVAAGLVIVALSILLPIPRAFQILLLAIGGWTIVSRNLPAILRASNAVSSRYGSLPTYHYDFYEDHMCLSGEGSMNIAYKNLIRLVEENRYYYLFTGPRNVMMVDRKTLDGKDDDFRTFLERHTGTSFRKAHSLFTMTLQDMLQRGNTH